MGLVEGSDTNLLGSSQKAWHSLRNWRGVTLGVVATLCAMTVFAFSVGAVSPTPVPTGAAGITNEATESAKKIEYYLPYPGILPDSPLYKLKMIRDRVKLWITWDEGEKAGVELMYADKRINAAMALASGNKSELAVSTATKAEKYLEAATNRVIKLIKLGQDEKSLLLRLEKAVAKHGEILGEIGNQGEETAGGLGEAMKLNQLLAERVGQTVLEEK